VDVHEQGHEVTLLVSAGSSGSWEWSKALLGIGRHAYMP
jgi:hypothetical protein